ncbi:MAG: hypothetical protein GY679_03080 [Mycoplasma sp.]|nr:hypothetical protein [Mycoplasma sp.]
MSKKNSIKKNKFLTKINDIQVKADPLRDRFNKLIIMGILGIVFLTLASRIITSVFLDVGFFNNKPHIHFWEDYASKILSDSNINQITVEGHVVDINFLNTITPSQVDELTSKLIEKNPIKTEFYRTWVELSMRSQRHPNSFWSLTQFTWQTTIIIFLIFSFRLFMYNGISPKSLKWINKQETLTLLTAYDMVVGIVFWTALFQQGFYSNFSNDPLVRDFEFITTILVHAIIPLSIFTYSLTYALVGRTTKSIEYKYLGIGSIYPIIYGIFYVIIAFTWVDPYPVTEFTKSKKDIWKISVAIIGILLFMAFSIFFHNKILLWNQYYKESIDKINKTKLNKIKTNKSIK